MGPDLLRKQWRARRALVAVRLYSHLLDQEVWLARDEQIAAGLEAEFRDIPVLTFAEVPYLQDKPRELLRALLEVKVTFPRAKLVS